MNELIKPFIIVMEFSSLLIYLKFDMFLRVIYGIVSTKQSGSCTKKKVYQDKYNITM